MKKLLFIFAFGIFFTFLIFDSYGRRRSVSNRNVVYNMPNERECNVDIDYCFNRYCFDKKSLQDGVYSKCGAEPASKILINVEDCLATRSVIKQLSFVKGCKTFTYNRIVWLLSNKDRIENGLKQNTEQCQYDTKMLQAAKLCHSIMISSDGSSSVDLYSKLNSLCGESVSGEKDMVDRFFNAGNYGLSDLQTINDLKSSGQNTEKRENWRQIVDSVLAGYTEIAELSCGKEDYNITKINDYLPDSRDNLSMIAMKEQAKQVGRKLGDRVVGRIFRESDCKNQKLPDGGLYWSYLKGKNPDCKLVCKEGYLVNTDLVSCSRKQDDESKFMGLNMGGWYSNPIGEQPDRKEQPIIDGGNGEEDKIPPVVEGTSFGCLKLVNNGLQYKSVSSKTDVCDTFCEKDNNGKYIKCNNRYEHEAGNICVDTTKNNIFNLYVKFKNVANILKYTASSRMGDKYSEFLSKEIREKCLGDNEAKIVDNDKGKSEEFYKLKSKCINLGIVSLYKYDCKHFNGKKKFDRYRHRLDTYSTCLNEFKTCVPDTLFKDFSCYKQYFSKNINDDNFSNFCLNDANFGDLATVTYQDGCEKSLQVISADLYTYDNKFRSCLKKIPD